MYWDNISKKLIFNKCRKQSEINVKTTFTPQSNVRITVVFNLLTN